MITILVNKDNPLDPRYVPNDLEISDHNENNFHGYLDPNLKPSVKREVLLAFIRMQEAALKEGYKIIIDSGYRSYLYQQDIWEHIVATKGLEYAKSHVALPGTSEHQTGLAIDIAIIRDGEYDDHVREEYPEQKWMEEHSFKYGFVLRYPKGKEEITGFDYEPWHFRYVGRNLALMLHRDNITLEEYYRRKKGNKVHTFKQV